MSAWVDTHWNSFKAGLVIGAAPQIESELWSFWTDWYEGILYAEGKSWSEIDSEILIENSLWIDDEPATVNRAMYSAAGGLPSETGMRFVVRKTSGNYYNFRLIVNNRAEVLRSDDYRTATAAVAVIEAVRLNAKDTEQYELLEAKNGPCYFNLKSPKGEILATSEMYASEIARNLAINQLVELFKDQEVKNSLAAPERPLSEANTHTTRFAIYDGKLDVVPTNSWAKKEDQANLYFDRSKLLADQLGQRLKTDAVPEVRSSVSILLAVLGTNVIELHPDQLRLASRTIIAKARTYLHPQAEWEISADSVSLLYELSDALIDLQSVVRTDIEAHEKAIRALDLTPAKAAEAKSVLDVVAEVIQSAPEFSTERVLRTFAADLEASNAAVDEDAKIGIEGDRILLHENLTIAMARELEIQEQAAQQTLPVKESTHLPDIEKPLRKARGRKPHTVNDGNSNKPPNNPPAATGGNQPDDDPSWEKAKERFIKRFYSNAPEKAADAASDALASTIKHGPKTIGGLFAFVATATLSSTIIAASGAGALAASWIAYRLWRNRNRGSTTT